MSLAVLYSRALNGMDAPLVTVEVHLANGLPSFTLVGPAEAEVKEARDRVRAALQNARFEFPARRITVNLAPADLPKESGRFDLPIALGILAASGQLPQQRLKDYEFAGELALTGELRPIRGALAMTFKASKDGRAFILPRSNADEAALVEDAAGVSGSIAARSLRPSGRAGNAQRAMCRPSRSKRSPPYPDFSEVKGQAHAKRALEVAAAGGHSILMSRPARHRQIHAGQPLARHPAANDARREALEAAAMQSLNGGFRLENWRRRILRSPHHSASSVALVGGGSNPRPGEISLAHHSVLFLDELPEFDRKALETLREPLESGRITISRAARQADFPAQFQLVAAMNPCPCGYLGHPNGKCHCTPDQVARYRSKISGPLLDRIDIQIEVPALPEHELTQKAAGEPSAAIQARVEAAYERQLARQGKANARLSTGNRRTMPAGCGRNGPAETGHQPPQPLRPRLSPHSQNGAHHCRSGRGGTARQHAYCGGGAIPSFRPLELTV